MPFPTEVGRVAARLEPPRAILNAFTGRAEYVRRTSRKRQTLTIRRHDAPRTAAGCSIGLTEGIARLSRGGRRRREGLQRQRALHRLGCSLARIM